MNENAEQQNWKKFKNKSRWFLFIGLLFVLISPTILTLPTFWSRIDFHETGQIGDTIGGITSPLVNLIGAILVYLSFEQQIEANRIQRDALLNEINENKRKSNYDELNQQLSSINQEVNSLVYTDTTQIKHLGTTSLIAFYNDLNDEKITLELDKLKDSLLLDIIYICLLIIDFCKRLDKSIITDEGKKYLALKIFLFFGIKIIVIKDLVEFFEDKKDPNKNKLLQQCKLVDLKMSELEEKYKLNEYIIG